MNLRVYVDQRRCLFCGICGGVCSEVFRVGSEGKSIALDIELTEDLLAKAKFAESLCPVNAIEIKN